MSSPYRGQITIDADLLHALWCYGNLHTVEGVVYSPHSHKECLAIVDRMFCERAQGSSDPAPQAPTQLANEQLWGRFVNHYWDSFEGEKQVVLKHIRAVLDYHIEHFDPAPSAASTVGQGNFMTLVHQYGANPTQEGYDAIYKRYLADCGAAPTTSPEPPSALAQEALSQIGSLYAVSSPEPDAVRDLAGVLTAGLAPKFDAFLNNPGNPHLAADLRQWFWDNKSGVLAALSRPAHGGWQPSLSEDESYALFLELDTLARSLAGINPIVNYFREKFLPIYRTWHAAHPGDVHPPLVIPRKECGGPAT